MELAPSRRAAWPSVLLWLSIGGVIGSIIWAVLGYGGLQDRLADLTRLAVPGRIEVVVAEPQTLTIFYEDPTSGGPFVVRTSGSATTTTPPVVLSVNGPSSEMVTTTAYERDLRFDYDGRLLTAISTFDAVSAGIYTIEASGNVPTGALISSGRVVEAGLVANVVGMVGLFLLSLVGMAVAAIARVVQRHDAPSNEVHRPMVGV
jgi:hypothetical protein